MKSVKKERTKTKKKPMNKTDKKAEKKGFKLSLFAMLITLSLIPLVLSVAVISVTSLYVTRNKLEKATKDTLYVTSNNLASYCHQNEITAINASNYFEYLDSLKEQKIEMAILIEGAVGTTSIKNENDFRVRDIPYEVSETGYYDKNVVIEGQTYYAYYMPIISDDGVIGMAFAGQLKNDVQATIVGTATIFVVLAIILTILFSVMALLISKRLSKSFATVGKNVNALSEGILKKQNSQSSFEMCIRDSRWTGHQCWRHSSYRR